MGADDDHHAESHTKAKVAELLSQPSSSWLMNRLWTFATPRSGKLEREAVEFGLITCSVFSSKQAVVAFSTYVLNLRTPEASLNLRYDLSVPFWAPFFATSSTASGCTVRTGQKL